MAVVEATIKTQLLNLYNDMKTTVYSEEDFADAMAGIIATAILSADVAFPIPVQVSTGTGTGGTTALGGLL